MYEPLFARWYGIRPWEIDRLTVVQFHRFVKEIKAEIRANQKGQ